MILQELENFEDLGKTQFLTLVVFGSIELFLLFPSWMFIEWIKENPENCEDVVEMPEASAPPEPMMNDYADPCQQTTTTLYEVNFDDFK